MLNWILWNTTIFIKMYLAFIQRLICHKTQLTDQPQNISTSIVNVERTPYLSFSLSLSLSTHTHIHTHTRTYIYIYIYIYIYMKIYKYEKKNKGLQEMNYLKMNNLLTLNISAIFLNIIRLSGRLNMWCCVVYS